MLSVRNAIISATLLLIMAIGASLLSMMQAPDSGGHGTDSYGTMARGYRALYETLEELGVETSRGFAPPDPSTVQATTLAFLSPSSFIAATEPSYITKLKEWLQEGGRILVAPMPADPLTAERLEDQLTDPPQSFLASVGLSGVEVVKHPENAPASGQVVRSRSGEPVADSIASELLDRFTKPEFASHEVDVSPGGEFDRLEGAISRLTVPSEDVAALECTDPPDGTVQYQDEGDSTRILVARYQRGAGEIIVVANPLLFSNRLIALSDNSVLAARLLSPGGSSVCFDEFYHGLGVRGQPLYLLTRVSYGTAAFGTLILIGIWTWRRAVFPGPPLNDRHVPRRDIREYVNAMARFFTEGGQGRERLVQEVRNGVLRQLCTDYGLAPDTTDVDRIADAVARKDARQSQLFSDAVRSIDRDLQSRRRWSETQTLDAVRRISACL